MPSLIDIRDIDGLIAPGAYPPRWGWHDDHAGKDKTGEYLPALQQVRAEYAALIDLINALPKREAALQLGLGPCSASHDAFLMMFRHVATIDFAGKLLDDGAATRGCSTHDYAGRVFATLHAPYDLLYIDAGHDEADVALDHRDYGELVNKGGLIVFHDALPRKGYPEVTVHKYLSGLAGVTILGDEVGTAWVKKT